MNGAPRKGRPAASVNGTAHPVITGNVIRAAETVFLAAAGYRPKELPGKTS